MPSQPCGLHRRHSRIESVVPYTSAPAKKGQVYFGRFYLGKRRQGRDAYSVAALFLGEGSINGTESPF